MEGQIQKNIKDCRDALVGKVPNPIEQVQQITLALIYKFMSDLDQQVIDIDGKATYFTKEYEKYSWNNIMSPRLQFQEKYNLYSEGIDKLKTHPKLTDVFRKVFKDAYLPYRDPATLVNFLNIINRFNYDDSEILGEAFESLLSTMGSQGDAGQFRTPRHIIDFIINIIEPTKTDTILDPACGTAGFLISAFKYIIKSNLKPQEKQALTENIFGYDIAPVMAEISAVNLYLHGFKNPKIFEYDTLTSTDRWQDKFDIILANPPFMTPKGGIKPHNLFELKANRAEVLFSEYIIEHLKSDGRSGFIVPEGIIFKSENAYKTLRKNFITQGLYCVVSLPSGVFQPYAGVKTSIIFIDKKLKKHNKDILFINIKNDGFDLGAKRKPIKDNDLPQAIEIVKEFKNCISSCGLEKFKNKYKNDRLISVVNVEEIEKGGDYNLSANRYVKDEVVSGKWEMVELGEVCEFKRGISYRSADIDESCLNGVPMFNLKSIKRSDSKNNNPDYKYFTGNYKDINIVHNNDILIAVTDLTPSNELIGSPLLVKISKEMINLFSMDLVKLIIKNSNINVNFLYYLLKSNNYRKYIVNYSNGSNVKHLQIDGFLSYKIPLPPLEIQEKIVAEIEEYEKIINGAKEVVGNWKPKIEVSKDWEIAELNSICNINTGGTPSRENKEYWENGTIKWLTSSVCKDQKLLDNSNTELITELGLNKSSAKLLNKNTTLIALVGATIGKTAFLPFEATTNQNIVALYPKNENVLNYLYLFYISQSLYNTFINLGNGGFKMANLSFVKSLQIPLPPLETQQQIVARIEEEQKYIDGCKKLIEIYEEKVKKVIDDIVAGEDGK